MKKLIYAGPIILIGITIIGIVDIIILLSGICFGYLLDRYISKNVRGNLYKKLNS